MSYSQLDLGEIMEGLIGIVITVITVSIFAVILGAKNSKPALYKDED